MHANINLRSRFAEAVSRNDEDIDLAEAALLMARDQYPNLNAAHYLEILDDIAQMVRPATAPMRSPRDVILALNGIVFLELGFRGNTENYYDPRNSYLNDVLDRRLGIPITLSVVYMEVARRIGFQLHGVGMPGHFIVKHCAQPTEIFIDPFNAGRVMDERDCANLLAEMSGGKVQIRPEHLAAATKRQILIRMLANLLRIYVEGADYNRALSAVEWILLIEPDSPEYTRERGLLLASTGRPNLALEELERYLRLYPAAPEAETIREQMKKIRQMRARLN